MGLTTKYSQREARDIWLRGIAYGLEEGIRLFTLEGQRLDLYNSCKTAKQQEFLAKSFELCDRFGMQIVYSPTEGMVVVETGRRAVVVTMENEVNPDESVDKDTVEDSNLIKVVDEPVLSDTQYNARKRKCGKCANSSNPSACISCSDYSKFEPSRYR